MEYYLYSKATSASILTMQSFEAMRIGDTWVADAKMLDSEEGDAMKRGGLLQMFLDLNWRPGSRPVETSSDYLHRKLRALFEG